MKAVFKTGGAVALLLASGCITTPRSRQVTDIYRDGGDGTRLAASVERESVQQFRYRLSPRSFVVFWHPLLWNGDKWDIRRKETLLYRRGSGDAAIREEREVCIRAEKSFFMWPNTSEMIRRQDEIYRYVLSEMDRARQRVGAELAVPVLCGVVEFCEKMEFGQKLLVRENGLGEAQERADGEVVISLLRGLPYTVAPTDKPLMSGNPLIDPWTTFNVRVFRCFTSAKSGEKLGTTDDVYVLKTEQARGDSVRQKLLN